MPQPFLPREESEVLDGGGERQRVERAVEHRLGPSELAGGVTQTKQVDELFGVDESGRNRQLVAHGVDEQQHRQHADGLLLRIVGAIAHEVYQRVENRHRGEVASCEFVAVHRGRLADADVFRHVIVDFESGGAAHSA